MEEGSALADGLPFILVMFAAALARSQSTYWLGRLVPALAGRYGHKGARLEKLDAWLKGPKVRRGAEILEKWGIIAIPLSFLTVGIQTLIQAAAGLVSMRWSLFTLASLPGCVAWALIYGAGILAGWQTVVAAAAGSPWAWGVLAIVAALIAYRVRKKRQQKGGRRAEPSGLA